MLTPITEHAPAKLNLFLHVTGKRWDGYHLLESLVVFTEFGDTLECYPDDTLSLDITGEFSDRIAADGNNSILKAARALKEKTGCRQGARIALRKRIPVAAGLGGGSGDAAAALRALPRLWKLKVDTVTLQSIARGLGSDVSVCLGAKPAMVKGTGEQVTPVVFPVQAWVVLVNPLIPVPTAEVFRRFSGGFDIAHALDPIDSFTSLICEMSERRNALTVAAVSLCPAIADALSALRETKDCQLARMTGSGATCFGLYEKEAQAKAAVSQLQSAFPGWWVAMTAFA